MFRIFKLAAWAAMGWAAYKSLEAMCRPEEEPAPGGGDRPRPEPEAPAAKAAPEAAPTPAPASAPAPQDLRKVKGIGPGIETLLNARGITTWAQLAATGVDDLRAILDQAGPRYRGHDPSTWPAQAAELAAAN